MTPLLELVGGGAVHSLRQDIWEILKDLSSYTKYDSPGPPPRRTEFVIT